LTRRRVLVVRQSVAPDGPCGQIQSRDREPPQADPSKQKDAKPSIRLTRIGDGRGRMDCNGIADAAVLGGAPKDTFFWASNKVPTALQIAPLLFPGSWRWVPDRQLVHCGHSWRTRFLQPMIVCVKLCKWRSFWAGSGGLAELGFLVLLKIVHVEISVRLEPVFVGLDSQRSDEGGGMRLSLGRCARRRFAA
jgi:hypothetical protein